MLKKARKNNAENPLNCGGGIVFEENSNVSFCHLN